MPPSRTRRSQTKKVAGAHLSPGTCILVDFTKRMADKYGDKKEIQFISKKKSKDRFRRWVEIIMREDGTDRLYCATVKKRGNKMFAFWFSPEDVAVGRDQKVVAYERADEPDEKEEHRQNEVERLHETLSQPGLRLDNKAVKEYPGYCTAPSQFIAKATILDLDATPEDREAIEEEVETLMREGARNATVRDVIDSMTMLDKAAHIAKVLSSSNKTREQLVKSFTKKKKPHLTPYAVNKCWASFCCESCKRKWTTVLGWAVYDPRRERDCRCHLLPRDDNDDVGGDKQQEKARRRKVAGCVHVLKDPGECVAMENFHDPHTGQVYKKAAVPTETAQPPTQGCKYCGNDIHATECELLWEQVGEGNHMAEFCPECHRKGGFCVGSAHHEDIVPRLVMVAHLIDEDLTWNPSDAGIEAETSIRGRRTLIQIVPWLFFHHKDKSDTAHQPHTLTGQESEMLRGDRIAAGCSEIKLLKRAFRSINAQFDSSNDNEDNATQDFHDSLAGMGGRLCGEWRAYSFNDITDYGAREGIVYYKPSGWVRKRVDLSSEILERIRRWPIMWHGTTLENAASIIFSSLHPPGSCGAKVEHGQAGSTTKRTIYLSPALGLSSHPVYSRFFEVGPGRWAQTVLQCKVRPGSWRVQQSTLGNSRHWPREVRIDPNFDSHTELECLCENADDIVVFGVMYREFGQAANRSLYGDLVAQVHEQDGKPEYCWSKLLEDDLRSKGLVIAQAC
eukprot:GEMP01007998.1.p1 GENE.GEMP01007998.1~~GEMP01007998.1.p1  ORF type:complete len:776 (+),score=133.97 GEMP01007998.1:132-2330(+)